MKITILSCFFIFFILISCKNDADKQDAAETPAPFYWENANLYFLLTDRFNNGNKTNDVNFGRTEETAVLRGFEGGDFAGVTQKINENYFTDLGVNALWLSPVFEQVHDGVDEGTGFTYPFHGYWIKDWTSVEPNFGTKEELQTMIDAAHAKGIRVVFDVVLNHTGPVTPQDPLWEGWARTSPTCTYQDYETTTACTLVKNLPDIYTESEEEVELPPHLLAKWEKEGRQEQELAELDAFFAETGLKRTAENYILKWLVDLIKDYGIDGFRIDTVKHTEEDVWKKLSKLTQPAFANWKKNNPDKVLDDTPFYTVGEVYNYNIGGGRNYDFGNRVVDYYSNGFDQLINFQFKYDAAQKSYEELFSYYRTQLDGPLKGKGVMNYLSSHDDGSPYDPLREKPFETGTKLILTPGTTQIYYGDETARILKAEGADGDAHLRTFMNWENINEEVHAHWQRLGQFRANHPAIGMGAHQMISAEPYVFSRIFRDDKVVIALDLPEGIQTISVGDVFADNIEVKDTYNNKTYKVENGTVQVENHGGIVLLEK